MEKCNSINQLISEGFVTSVYATFLTSSRMKETITYPVIRTCYSKPVLVVSPISGKRCRSVFPSLDNLNYFYSETSGA
jgi:hypothetical protein